MHYLFSNGWEFEHSESLVEHAGTLADIDNHGRFATTTEEILEEPSQSALTEWDDLVLSVTDMSHDGDMLTYPHCL